MLDLMEGWAQVTVVTHPRTYTAFDATSLRLGAGHHETYCVPPEYARRLLATEDGLGQYRKSELKKLYRGDYEVSHPSIETMIAYDVVSAFAHGWPTLLTGWRRGRRRTGE